MCRNTDDFPSIMLNKKKLNTEKHTQLSHLYKGQQALTDGVGGGSNDH